MRNDIMTCFILRENKFTNDEKESLFQIEDLIKSEKNIEKLKLMMKDKDVSILKKRVRLEVDGMGTREISCGALVMRCAAKNELYDVVELFFNNDFWGQTISDEIFLTFVLSEIKNPTILAQLIHNYKCQHGANEIEKFYFANPNHTNTGVTHNSWFDIFSIKEMNLTLKPSDIKIICDWIFDNIPLQYCYSQDNVPFGGVDFEFVSAFCKHQKIDIHYQFGKFQNTLLHCVCVPIECFNNISQRIKLMQFLLENEADIEIMDIFGRTPLEELFCPAYYRPEEEIEENEIVAILKFVLSNYKVSSRVLMILFLKSLQWGNFDYVPTLILNYALEKNDFDVRKSVIKINPKFCDNFKFTIQNLKSTEELQNELLEDEPLIEKTKQKKRKRETKKTQNKTHNHKKEKMKNNDHKEEKAKTVKVKPVSTSDKNIQTFQKLPDFVQNTTTYIENLKSKNLELKQVNEQQKLMLETIESQDLNSKNEIKNLKQKLRKQIKTSNLLNQELQPSLQARYLVENIFQDFFPSILIKGDLYQSIQNLRKIKNANPDLCDALEYCRKAGNSICHLTNRSQFEEKQFDNLDDKIKISFLTIFQELPDFTPKFESSLWKLISS